MEVVASLSQGRTAAAQCGLFTYKSVPVIFEPPSISIIIQTIFRELVCSLLKSLILKFVKNVKSQCGDAAAR